MSKIQDDPNRYFEFPKSSENKNGNSLFLGGGISGCPDWQKPTVERLAESCKDLFFYNPRRAIFDLKNAEDSIPQIQWEHKHLKESTAILFWFPKETLCPITLYELGAWSVASPKKQIFLGVHPEYSRKVDICEQTRLVRPDIQIVDDLEKLSKQVEEWYSSLKK